MEGGRESNSAPEGKPDKDTFVRLVWARVNDLSHELRPQDRPTLDPKLLERYRLRHPLHEVEKLRARLWEPGGSDKTRSWIAFRLAQSAIHSFQFQVDAKSLRQRTSKIERGDDLVRELSQIVEELDDLRFYPRDMAAILAGDPREASARDGIVSIAAWLDANRVLPDQPNLKDKVGKRNRPGPREKFMGRYMANVMRETLGEPCTAAVAAVIWFVTGKDVTADDVYDWVRR